MPAPSRRNVPLRHLAAPCLPFNIGHLYMGLYRYYKDIFKTGTEVLSIVLLTCSSNARSCLVCRLKGKTLLLPYLYGEERPNQLRGASTTRRFTGGESRTSGESFPFCQDIHHHSSTYVLSFSVTLDPNESMPAPSRRNVLLRHHAHPCLPFNVHLWPYIYTWASIDATSIFKTGTEVFSYTLLLAIRGRVLCVV